MHVDAFTSYRFDQMGRLWNDAEDLEIADDAVGITWFGGDSISKEHEPMSHESDAPIVRLAREVTRESEDGCE